MLPEDHLNEICKSFHLANLILTSRATYFILFNLVTLRNTVPHISFFFSVSPLQLKRSLNTPTLWRLTRSVGPATCWRHLTPSLSLSLLCLPWGSSWVPSVVSFCTAPARMEACRTGTYQLWRTITLNLLMVSSQRRTSSMFRAHTQRRETGLSASVGLYESQSSQSTHEPGGRHFVLHICKQTG